MDGLILIGLILWVALSLMSKAAKVKNAEQAKKQRTLTTHPGTLRPAPAQKPTPSRAFLEFPQQMERPSLLTPEGETMMPRVVSIERAGEGEDPCHDDMLQPVTSPTEDAQAGYQQVRVIPGLQIHLNRNSLLQGIVFSEILNRRVPRRTYR